MPLTPSRARLFDLSVGLVEDVSSASAPAPAAANGVTATAFSPEFQLALPYRGFFVWHVGRDEVAGDANQALFVTGGERYRLSHPIAGGFAELIVTPTSDITSELAHSARLRDLRQHPLFRRRSRCLTPRLQSFRARFLSWAAAARSNGAGAMNAADVSPDDYEALAAEEMVLALLRAAISGDDHADTLLVRPGRSTQRLIRRTKAFLEAEIAKPIRLTDIGRAAGASPLYLTQVFRAVEGVPLHQYLTRLRLAHALAELPTTSDLTKLALDVGFSSHSHFTSRFRRAFGMPPSRFRELSRRGLRPTFAPAGS